MLANYFFLSKMKTSEFKIFMFYVSLVMLSSVESNVNIIVLDSNDWPEIKYNYNNDVDSTADFLDELFVNDALVTTTPPEKQTMMIETPSEWTNNFEDYPLKNSKIKMANTRTTMTTTTSNTTTMTSTSLPTSMSSLTTSALTITSATTTTGTC